LWHVPFWEKKIYFHSSLRPSDLLWCFRDHGKIEENYFFYSI
jgi:hypothetical protein